MNKSNMIRRLRDNIIRLIDKFQAMCCLLVAREFVIFTCRKFLVKKGLRSWISYGFVNGEKNGDVFLKAIQNFCDKWLETKYHQSSSKLNARKQKQALIDKACAWIDTYSQYRSDLIAKNLNEKFIDEFRKAMEEEK